MHVITVLINMFPMFVNSLKKDQLLKLKGPNKTKKLVKLVKTRADQRFTKLFLKVERLGNKMAGETHWKQIKEMHLGKSNPRLK